jgi:hypothetical protein
LAALLTLGAERASAQQMSQRGQPKTAFALSDFGKLHWLEGTWVATSLGETTLYEKFHFADDSTVDITYYRDAGMAQPSGTGRLYLSVGRVYHSFGPNRWGATHVGADGVFFVPQVNARNTFAWDFKSDDEWTVTMRSGLSGRDRVTVWDLKRLK